MPEPKSMDELLDSLPKNAKGCPGVHVPKHGDCLFVYLENTPYERVYVDAYLTVFEALDDRRLVGFELKGLSKLEAESFEGLDFHQNPPIIALLFASFHLHADGVEKKGSRVLVYSKAATAAAKALDLQEA